MDVEPLFPVFLKLGARRVVVVGAGPVAAGKAAGLVAVAASVVVVAPDVCDAMQDLPVTIERRGFRPSDLDGAWYVVAAAPAEVNRAVAAAAADRQIFVNAVDDPAPASAYAGSVVSRGPVTLAISTSGLAPAVAGLLREALDDLLPADLERWVDEAVRERVVWKRDGVPIEARRGRLLDRLNELYRYRTSADSAELGRVAGDRR
jgi:siroheme synthase-like protein